jgi:hypothetical protein
MRQWFVGMTRDANRSQKDLRDHKFGVFLPKTFERIQEGRKVHARARMRFPGYIFIACEADDTGSAKKCSGMDDSSGSAVLGGAKPVAISPEIIERLRRLEDDEFGAATEIRRPEPRKDLVPGDLVEFAEGKAGIFVGSERGMASVIAGPGIWKVPEGDLKRVEIEKKAA